MDKLTKKQRIFVKEYVKDENGTQAAIKAYDIKDNPTARSIGSENLTKPNIISAIKAIADRIPDELLEQVHLEGLGADREGFPDYSVRHKYLDSAYKLKGQYAPDKSVNVNINATTFTDEEKLKLLGLLQ